ncbi:MAG: aminopeptidase P N-terminal domain-containing protein [Cyclobacteriaceae bacterium]|nr:aminopeptidase P N-terminal domain-containing protein [Cyclobacteriaceae bacterium]
MKYEDIGSELFLTNRMRLVKALPKGAIAVFNSNDHMPTNADGTMPFKQNNDLFYLTGVQQEESCLVICPDFPDKNLREVLFLREPNELLEKWEGHKLTKNEAKEIAGVTTVRWNGDFQKVFHHMMVMGGVSSVFLNTNEHYRSSVVVQTRDARFIEWCKSTYPLHRYERVAPIMAGLRTIKQKREIELMQKACDITEKGFRRILGFVKPGVMEYEIEAEYVHEFIMNRSRGFAYEPIIASGVNNCVLHYLENNKECKAGDLILLDVAAEYANYNSDLTRTIPVSGRFTKRQKDVYNAVLRVMRGAIQLMGPTTNFFNYQREVEKMMEEELLKLKLISKSETIKKNPENPGFRKYFYHGTSHLIGLDVHDVGDMHAKMAIGSAWTVEPGIYIQEEGFGIRLENNVVIKKNGVVDLMKNIPIEAEEIEELMNR